MLELTLRWCCFAIIVNDGGGVPHITNIPHTKTNISQMSHISRQISKIPHICLIFSTDLAHGDSVKDVEPENAKVSQVLPARVKSTCHWLSLSAAAKVLFIEILDFAKS